jgi:U32 family peptidase
MNTLLGKVTHYYDKIGVAVVELSKKGIAVGDTLMFSGHDQEFKQTLESIQVEHENIKKAKKGLSVGIKVDRKVKENDKVYLVK